MRFSSLDESLPKAETMGIGLAVFIATRASASCRSPAFAPNMMVLASSTVNGSAAISSPCSVTISLRLREMTVKNTNEHRLAYQTPSANDTLCNHSHSLASRTALISLRY